MHKSYTIQINILIVVLVVSGKMIYVLAIGEMEEMEMENEP